MASLTQELRGLRKLRLDRDRKKDTYEAAEAKYKAKEREVYERMEQEEVGSTSVAGVNFVPASTTYAHIQDRSEFIAWAKENDESLLQEKERADLLNQLVRERLDNGEPLPPGLGLRVREYISQRAA